MKGLNMNTNSMKLIEEIDKIKAELAAALPRSRRKIELEDRLKTLVTKLLRNENRLSKRGESMLPKNKTRTRNAAKPKTIHGETFAA